MSKRCTSMKESFISNIFDWDRIGLDQHCTSMDCRLFCPSESILGLTSLNSHLLI